MISRSLPLFHICAFLSKSNKPPRLGKKRLNSNKAIEDMLTDMSECDISKKLNNDLSSDPNSNYDIIHDHIVQMKDTHLPYKFEKFQKHKHKNNKWISFGIIRSIKTRYIMYQSLTVVINKVPNTIHWKIIFICSTVYWKIWKNM